MNTMLTDTEVRMLSLQTALMGKSNAKYCTKKWKIRKMMAGVRNTGKEGNEDVCCNFKERK